MQESIRRPGRGLRRAAGAADRIDRIGFGLVAGATIMFFLGFVFAYFYLRSLDNNGLWRPAGVDPPTATGSRSRPPSCSARPPSAMRPGRRGPARRWVGRVRRRPAARARRLRRPGVRVRAHPLRPGKRRLRQRLLRLDRALRRRRAARALPDRDDLRLRPAIPRVRDDGAPAGGLRARRLLLGAAGGDRRARLDTSSTWCERVMRAATTPLDWTGGPALLWVLGAALLYWLGGRGTGAPGAGVDRWRTAAFARRPGGDPASRSTRRSTGSPTSSSGPTWSSTSC